MIRPHRSNRARQNQDHFASSPGSSAISTYSFGYELGGIVLSVESMKLGHLKGTNDPEVGNIRVFYALASRDGSRTILKSTDWPLRRPVPVPPCGSVKR